MSRAHLWTSAAALALVGAVLGAGCGTAQINELADPALECDFFADHCTCVPGTLATTPRQCTAKSVGGTCCKTGYSCTCYSLGCSVDGNICTCGVADSPMTSCSPPSGVCCVSPESANCKCYYDLGACPGGEQPVANCQIGVLTCGVIEPYSGASATKSCSSVRVTDVDYDPYEY